MIELKSASEIEAVRAAGAVVGSVLTALCDAARVGVTTLDLDGLARDLIEEAGATSSFLGYHPSWASRPYAAVICASVNDAVVHGPPGPAPLRDGDLLSLDLAVHLDGWCADAAVTVPVGTADPGDRALVEATERALAAGIAAARPGGRLGDIAHAVTAVARDGGFGLLADHGGHGIGRAMHEDPGVPNHGRAGRGMRLRPGLVLALEPMLLAGGRDAYRHDVDGWTVRTADGSRAAHAEHTVAVTEDGPRVLTSSGPDGHPAR